MTTKIIRNSAKCAYCGAEIESTYGHDFKCHVCRVKVGVEFCVDGGKNYIRRVGGPNGWDGMIETSVMEEV